MTQAARLAALDASLRAGRMPDNLGAELAAAGVAPGSRIFETPAGYAVIDSYTADVAGERGRFHGHRFANSFSTGLLWGAGGVLVGALTAISGAPLVLGGAALVFGAARDWYGTTARNEGTVQVAVDGRESTKRYCGSPNMYERSPQEIRADLFGAGVLGDRIEPAQALRRLAKVDSARFEPRLGEMRELVRTRRLVANLGARSRYGVEVLQVVPLTTALQLLQAGREVFVVHGKAVTETRHTHAVRAARLDGAVRATRDQSVIERTFIYDLAPFHADGPSVAAGKGVPPAMHGVAAHGGTFSDVVRLDEAKSYDERSNDPTHDGGRQRRTIRERASGYVAVTA